MPFKSVGDEELEKLLNRATSPNNSEVDMEAVMAFCDQVNKELEGAQISVKLLAHKLQSPQEKEALYTLAVLEACVKNCGKVFHQEIGKFKFLNEIIKVVSPKYLGSISSERVKTRCIELMYSWSKGLTHEPKINEAYGMLKKQGIVRQDPLYVDQRVSQEEEAVRLSQKASLEPEPNSLFSEDKSKQLNRLLKSKNPDDLIAANRLIKNMVKEDNDRLEKMSKRLSDLETVKNNTKLLADMLDHYSSSNSASDLEIMKQLYTYIEEARPNLFRLASETDPADSEGIQEILRVNDDASDILKRYKDTVDESAVGSAASSAPATAPPTSNLNLLEDMGFGAAAAAPSAAPPPYSEFGTSNGVSVLDDQLASLGLGAPSGPAASGTDLLQDLLSGPIPAPVPMRAQKPSLPSAAVPEKQEPVIKGFEDIDLLGQQLMQEIRTSGLSGNKSAAAPPPPAAAPERPSSTSSSLDDALLFEPAIANQQTGDADADGDLLPPLSPPRSPSPPPAAICDLSAVEVQLAEVQPASNRPPLCVLSARGVTVTLHPTLNKPHPHINVFVVTITSTCAQRLTQVTFQSAVPKHMKVRMQAPTSTELPASSPFLPPSATNQIMLIQNSANDKVRLKYRLMYRNADQQVVESGETDIEPEPETGSETALLSG